MTEVRIVTVSLHNLPVGESHFRAYSDSVLARAKTLRAQGWTLAAISAELGPHVSTLSRWLDGSGRASAVKVIARRVRSE